MRPRATAALLLAVVAAVACRPVGTPHARPPAGGEPVTIPFELVRRHIVLAVSVNGSRPLSFLLDTGDKYAVLDLGRAKELGVDLGASVDVGGVGAARIKGAFVNGATFSVSGLEGFSQPVTLSFPLESLTARLGHDFDGILGADFIQEFVVEVDYAERVLRLHDRNAWRYSGPGESIPIHVNRMGHPILDAEVTPIGRAALAGRFTLDLGSGSSLALLSPFVAENELPGPGVPTVEAIGGGGTGGQATGRIGRVEELRIGRFSLHRPVTLFSADTSGAFASDETQGNIGQRIASRFKLFLDYRRDRIVFEPAESFGEPFELASAGADLLAEGPDYSTLRIQAIREGSPAAAAGLRADDVIVAIGDRVAPELTLDEAMEILEKPTPCLLTLKRGAETLLVSVTPRSID